MFSFPDDLVYDCTSTYDVKVTLTAKTSGHTDEYSIMPEIMFCTTTADPTFGSLYLQDVPGYFEIEAFETGDIGAVVLHEETIGAHPGGYLLSTDIESKKNMTGNTEVCPEAWEGGHRSYGEAYIWNAAVPEKKWEIVGPIYNLDFTLVNSAEEILDMEQGDPSFDATAPIIKGQQNIICIQGSSEYDYYVENDISGVNEPCEVIQIPVTLISGQIPEVSLQAQPSDRTAQSAGLTADISSLYGIKTLWYQEGILSENEYGEINYSNMEQVTLDEENRLCNAETGE